MNAAVGMLGFQMLPQDSSSLQSPLFWILITGIVVGLVVLAQQFIKAKSSVSNPDNIATIRAQQVAIFQAKLSKEFKDRKSLQQAIREQAIEDRENCLMNFQPLTVIHPGYLGPPKDGVYDEQEGISSVIRMGARCFVMPIDYHTKDTMPAAFPAANKPCLLYRDGSDTIRSLNAGSIRKAAQTLANAAWSDSINQRNDPFILILYFVRTPAQGTRQYLDFLSQVAVELEPLTPYLLGQTPEGVYNRQARQDQLLFVDTTQFEKKLLVFCNVDTSGFRSSAKDFKKTYLPKEDLDYWVHLRMFKQNIETPLGATDISEKAGIPRGLMEMVSYYTSLPSDQRTLRTAVAATKEKFTVALSLEGTNPTLDSSRKALNTFGVQALPLLITDATPELMSLMKEWKYAWRAKPKEILYIRPAPQVIALQSPKANARGGVLSVPA